LLLAQPDITDANAAMIAAYTISFFFMTFNSLNQFVIYTSVRYWIVANRKGLIFNIFLR